MAKAAPLLLSLAIGAGASAPSLGGLKVVGHGYKNSSRWQPHEEMILNPTGEMLVADDELPRSWDWRNVEGRSFATPDWNQHIPQYCGACWIHGTMSALNDRIKVMRNAAFPDVVLSRQAVMNCVPDPSGEGPPPGCNGGDPIMIHRYLHKYPVGDETCLPYQARNMGCSAENVCRNCLPDGAVPPGQNACFPILSFTSYGVSEYGKCRGELAMMKEIFARGPIVCSAATDMEFLLNYSANAAQHEGVYVTDKQFNETEVDHNIEVVGWGETPTGLKYWLARNSWGTYWGEAGWFKVRRGVNQQLFEADCDWAIPNFSDLDSALTGQVLGFYMTGLKPTYAINSRNLTTDGLLPLRLSESAGRSSSSIRDAFLAVLVGITGLVLLLSVQWHALLGSRRGVVQRWGGADPPLLGVC